VWIGKDVYVFFKRWKRYSVNDKSIAYWHNGHGQDHSGKNDIQFRNHVIFDSIVHHPTEWKRFLWISFSQLSNRIFLVLYIIPFNLPTCVQLELFSNEDRRSVKFQNVEQTDCSCLFNLKFRISMTIIQVSTSDIPPSLTRFSRVTNPSEYV